MSAVHPQPKIPTVVSIPESKTYHHPVIGGEDHPERDRPRLHRTDWAVVAVDDLGLTVDAVGPDPEALADKVASWAQQEVDKWPEMGLIYMLILPNQLVDALAQQAEGAGSPADV